jgi:hypothetical protein
MHEAPVALSLSPPSRLQTKTTPAPQAALNVLGARGLPAAHYSALSTAVNNDLDPHVL